ncbi:MAG: diacylglycerol kinase [Abditibacteriota bacterium]|nr:diacylglycerol kinase [Abditibacteriota bacterium]
MEDKDNSPRGFKFAMEGIEHAFRTQQHMRFHFLCIIIVGILCILLKLNYIEVCFAILSVAFVIFAEMINTAMEAVVDMVSQKYHPLAKFAKDIAAGAVLVASINAVLLGAIILFNHSKIRRLEKLIDYDSHSLTIMIIFAFFILMSLIVMYKVAGNKGKIWRGGVISVHSSIGFFLAWTVFFIEKRIAVTVIALILAGLVAQSRVEGGIHSVSEVIWGAIIATVVAFLIFTVIAPIF